MQTQVRTTFRNWFSPPIVCELRIELSSSGWLQASSPDEPSHLPKSHFFFPSRRWIPLPRTTMWSPASKKCGDLQLLIVPANLILHGSFVMEFNIPSPDLTHVFPCCGASAEVSAAPVRAPSRPSLGWTHPQMLFLKDAFCRPVDIPLYPCTPP